MTPADLRRILDAMTPGPWHLCDNETSVCNDEYRVTVAHTPNCRATHHENPYYNATGIAALRNAAEALVALWEASERLAVLERARDDDDTELNIVRGAVGAAIVRLKEVKL